MTDGMGWNRAGYPVDAGRRTPDTGRAGATIHATAPAKINLRLKVLAREENGYHQLETIFCAIGLEDRLEFERGRAGLELEVVGAELGPPSENLVHRAAIAFFDTARIEPSVRIRLEKRVPAGAGLGGGSSDAATTLVALNELFGEPLSNTTLFRLGAALGSDIPFFLSGASMALAWGRGERILPLPKLPTAPLIVIVPEFPISTAEAYRDLAEARAARADYATPAPAIIEQTQIESWEEVAAIAENDFESTGFARYPKLREIKVALQDAGATIALMAGSGSALFGIFRESETLEDALPLVRVAAPGCKIISTSTATIG